MAELTVSEGSQRKALTITGVPRATWQYRQKPRPKVAAPIHQKDRAYQSRISSEDRALISGRVQAGWAKGNSVDHSFATTWDDGLMWASRRSWWRIAQGIEDQSVRPLVKTRRGSRTPREAPVLKATGPGQVWSWDITDLPGAWRGKAFKKYSIIDIYSRMIVGWRVEECESDHLAVQMFQTAFAQHGAPQFVHADSGAAMRSNALKNLLQEHHVEQTHNRPYVSNDNPFSESGFRTMKYRPNYPGTFPGLDEARAHVNVYVPWYNEEHKHSGIALFSPRQVHDGSWRQLHQVRHRTQQAYYEKHPERYRAKPCTASPAGIVGINLPETENTIN